MDAIDLEKNYMADYNKLALAYTESGIQCELHEQGDPHGKQRKSRRMPVGNTGVERPGDSLGNNPGVSEQILQAPALDIDRYVHHSI